MFKFNKTKQLTNKEREELVFDCLELKGSIPSFRSCTKINGKFQEIYYEPKDFDMYLRMLKHMSDDAFKGEEAVSIAYTFACYKKSSIAEKDKFMERVRKYSERDARYVYSQGKTK